MTRERAEKIIISSISCEPGCYDCQNCYIRVECNEGSVETTVEEAIKYLKEQIRIDNINKKEFK
jgi:hypothetical protein